MGRLVGYAVRWGSESVNLGGFVEVFRRGAFARSLRGGGDVFFLNSHHPHELLGSRQAGTLQVSEDEIGLRFELETPATTLGSDVAELVRLHVLRNMSFGFRIKSSAGERWSEHGDTLLREVLEADLLEVSTTAFPAYRTSSITAREARSASASVEPIGPSAAVRRAAMRRRLLDAKLAA